MTVLRGAVREARSGSTIGWPEAAPLVVASVAADKQLCAGLGRTGRLVRRIVTRSDREPAWASKAAAPAD